MIIRRRKFLFLAPAVIAASQLMPGHSIGDLRFTKYHAIRSPNDSVEVGHLGYIRNDALRKMDTHKISEQEYEWNRKRILSLSHHSHHSIYGSRWLFERV